MALDRSSQNWPDGVFEMTAVIESSNAHEKAMRDWHELFAYNGEKVPYFCMTVDQRLWVQKRANHYRNLESAA